MSAEWSYVQDELGVVYCLGRDTGLGVFDAVATYYKTTPELATKQTIDMNAHYRRFIYQGLPEERERLKQVERPDVVDRLLSRTSLYGVGLTVDRQTLAPSNPEYSKVISWLQNNSPLSALFRTALEIAGTALTRAGVEIEDLSLYGGAAFGVVNSSLKNVDDVDFLFSMNQRDKLNTALETLRSNYKWSEIDPEGRLPKVRQLLKAKRWSTSQVRLDNPYPFSIDFKIRRDKEKSSLWDNLPENIDMVRYSEKLKVVDDTESLCISPALKCEDTNGNEYDVLFDGYQYIGCAVVGDEITVCGNKYCDSNVVHITQSDSDHVIPDFRQVPIV